MIRLSNSAETSSQDGYPSASVLREAHRLANTLPPGRVREYLRDFFYATCRCVLGKGDREELLEGFLARRERARGVFLEGCGLARDPEVTGCYWPGTWSLSGEQVGRDCWFVINGVQAISGEVVSVRLSARQFMSAKAALRAIKKAVHADEPLGLSAAEWRPIWNGFDYCDSSGLMQRAMGLRVALFCFESPNSTKNPPTGATRERVVGKRMGAPEKRS